MSVVQCHLIDRSFHQGPQWKRTFVEKFRVFCDNLTDDSYTALTGAQADGFTSRVPAYYASHASDSNSLATDLACEREGNWKQGGQTYLVTATYSNDREQGGGNGGNDNNQAQFWVPEISWAVQFVDEVVEKDVDGNPIDNAAGEPFDPPLTVPVPIMVCKYKRYDGVPPVAMIGYLNKVNSVAWNGMPAKAVRFSGIDGERVIVNGYSWYHNTYEFQTRATWTKSLLNIGFKHRVAQGANAVPNWPQGKKELLDNNGLITQNATYLSFDIYSPVDFTPLAITLF